VCSVKFLGWKFGRKCSGEPKVKPDRSTFGIELISSFQALRLVFNVLHLSALMCYNIMAELRTREVTFLSIVKLFLGLFICQQI